MTNCMFGLPSENWARTGIVTASASVSGLGPDQMQGGLGATSTSWQTPAGATSAHVAADAGAAVAWGAFGLFNANLTPAATVRLLSDPLVSATGVSAVMVPSSPVSVFQSAARVDAIGPICRLSGAT